jgi:hypothetical protein
MPPIDPADVRARARRELGLSRELQQTRSVPPHPRHGSTGYPVFYGEEQLQNWQTGLPINVSRASISRWLVRIHPYRQTGNKERSQIVGIDLLQLINFIIAYPDATIDEMIVFMYNQGGELE